MSEEINQLRALAKEYATKTMETDWHWHFDYDECIMEKFAELIVLKCAKAAQMAYDIDLDCPEIYIIESLGLGTENGSVDWWFANKHLIEKNS